MKSTSINTLGAIFLLLVGTLTGCVNQITDTPEGMEDTNDSALLTVYTRANDGSALNYPVTLYAFDADGACAATKQLSSAADDTRMRLSAGTYTLVALSGTDGYSMPAVPKMSDVITLADGIPSTKALWAGSGVATIGDHTTTVNITLTAAISRINLSLTGIPTDVTAVSVTMGSLYEGISFGGKYSGNTMSAISLKNTEGTTAWSASDLHIFPGLESTRLSLTITLNRADGTTVVNSYTADRTLLGNTPYRLTGNYAEGFGVSSNLTWSQWNEEQVIDFSFGNKDNGGSEDNGDNTVTALPAVGSVWNGHFVALSSPNESGSSAVLTLLSLQEWVDVPAAVEGSTDPTAATSCAASYSEKGTDGSVSNWRIPTKDDMKAIRDAVGGTDELLFATNTTLSGMGAVPISYGEEKKGVPIRYLCQDATQSINFYGTTGVTGCGYKRTYRLRLVRNVTVSTTGD